jgi:hypothetical protein
MATCPSDLLDGEWEIDDSLLDLSNASTLPSVHHHIGLSVQTKADVKKKIDDSEMSQSYNRIKLADLRNHPTFSTSLPYYKISISRYTQFRFVLAISRLVSEL